MSSTASTNPTLASIARKAGVSIPTVSKVINDYDDVAPATRQRVKRQLDLTGYVRRPRPGWRGEVQSVSLVLDELDRPECGPLLRGAAQAAGVLGMNLVVTGDLVDRGRGTLRRDAVNKLRATGTSGLVLAFVHVTEEQRHRLEHYEIPYVLLTPPGNSPPDANLITTWDEPGARTATDHLIRLGHRRVAALGTSSRDPAGRARLTGYRAALTEGGLVLAEELISHGEPSEVSGYARTMRLLSLPEPPTAAFVCAEGLVPGVYRALRERDMSVPGDFSVVGHGDLTHARWMNPPLTTLREPFTEMAAAAVHALYAQAADLDTPRRLTEVPASFVERASTRQLSESHGRMVGAAAPRKRFFDDLSVNSA